VVANYQQNKGHFSIPRIMDLDDALEYIDDSELVEITPKSIHIRKIVSTELEEKRRRKNSKQIKLPKPTSNHSLI